MRKRGDHEAHARVDDVFHGVPAATEGDDAAADAVNASGLYWLADGIAWGRKYISNPDLAERFRAGAELAPDNFKTWYTPGPEGYIDYPALETVSA